MSTKSYIKSLFGVEESPEDESLDTLLPLPDRFGEFNYSPLGGTTVTSITEEFTKVIVSTAVRALFSNKLLNEQSFIEEVRNISGNNMSSLDILSLTEESFVEAIIYGLLTSAEGINNNNFTQALSASNEDVNKGIITPWTIELAKRTSNLTQLLGPTRISLPIIVTVDGTNNYVHACTEELIYGLLSTMSSDRFTFRMADIPNDSYHLHLEDISPNYNATNSRYICLIGKDETTRVYTFNTVDFIKGAVTSCEWLNIDPYTYIINIRSGNKLFTF